MKIIEDIPVDAIRVDRAPIDSKVFMYAVAMLRGDKFPPIRVARLKEGGYEIRDGRHRVSAAKLVARGKIRAAFSEVPLLRRVVYAIANQDTI